jgi:hypothetical protein
MAKYNLVQTTFNRDQLRPDEDDAAITFHIREVVQAAPDIIPVTDQGRADFINRMSQWWQMVAPHVTRDIFMHESRFYDIPDGGPFPAKDPRAWMGDPVLVHAWNSPGQDASGALPPQVAVSVTLRTAHRKRWGRYYIPSPGQSVCSSLGAIDQLAAVAFKEATHHLTSRSGTGAAATVFSRLHWDHEDPETIQVDDIFDVVRRRRFSSPLYREKMSAG